MNEKDEARLRRERDFGEEYGCECGHSFDFVCEVADGQMLYQCYDCMKIKVIP